MVNDLKTISNDLRQIQQEALKAAKDLESLKIQLAQIVQTRMGKGVPGGMPLGGRAYETAERILERGEGRYRAGEGYRVTASETNLPGLSKIIAEFVQKQRIFTNLIDQLNARLS